MSDLLDNHNNPIPVGFQYYSFAYYRRVSFIDSQLYTWLYVGFWNWLLNGAFHHCLLWKAEMFDLTRVYKWANHFRLCLWLPPQVSLLLEGIRSKLCISLCVFHYTRDRNINLYEYFGSNFIISINFLNQRIFFFKILFPGF